MTDASYLTGRLWKPVDNSPLIVFRILAGALFCFECLNEIISGRVTSLFVTPIITFPFIGFEWLQPLPGNGMYWYYIVMAIAALLISAGAFYRISAVVFTLMWTIAYLMQKCWYNNHFYLIILIGLLLCCTPAHRRSSVDAVMGRVTKSATCPQWAPWLFIAQFIIVYTFAGINKFYPDWLSGRYMALLMENRIENRTFQLFLCYGGILFDLLVMPLLLWRKTRLYALGAALCFHLFNAVVFDIGIFPFLALSATVFCFPPEQVGLFLFRKKPAPVKGIMGYSKGQQRLVMYLIMLYLLVQILLPLRYLLYSTTPWWTEEGARMSWRMMLRNKKGWVYYRVIDPVSGKVWTEEPEQRLNNAALNSLAGAPDLIWQYAQYLEQLYHEKGYGEVKIYALSQVSLNGRTPQALVDPATDLSHEEWQPFRHHDWILPLND